MAERITGELHLIQEALGDIPESFFSNALEETEDEDEDAQALLRWLSEQGQYNCVIAQHNTRHLIRDDSST